jgi:23S rRNA (uracil1939-C5)-methyltransferase
VIEKLDDRGQGVGQTGSLGLALRHAVPGSRVRAEVLRKRGKRSEGRVIEVLHPGPDSVTPDCPHFGTCGGCAFQNFDYAGQLEALRLRVQRHLEEAGVASGVEVEAVLPSPSLRHYRNKMEFTFGNRRWRGRDELEASGEERDADFALGLHVPGRHDKVLDLEDCTIAFGEAAPLLRSVRELARSLDLVPWDVRTHSGSLRHLVLRKGHFTGQVLLALVTSEEAPEAVEALARALSERHPEITTLVQLINTRAATVAVGERQRVLHGDGWIHERLCGLEYRVSAASFFQTNSQQAERLVEVVREESGIAGASDAVIWDLYCGAGTFALDLARTGARVLGIESAPSAVEDAERNARANGIESVRFLAAEVEQCLDGADALGPEPEVCVVDPPRAGLHPRALRALSRCAARRLVLVSCNPQAGARDVAALSRAGWALSRIRPLDLFPHTPHVECVLSMDRVQ